MGGLNSERTFIHFRKNEGTKGARSCTISRLFFKVNLLFN